MRHYNYNLSMAEKLFDKEPTPVTIIIASKLPEFESLRDAGDHYKSQARLLFDCLTNALPQGTRLHLINRLIANEIAEHGYFRGL